MKDAKISKLEIIDRFDLQFCWSHDSKVYKHSKFQPKTMSYEGDMSFQRWQLNSASKQISWRNMSKLRFKASKPASKFLFQQFSYSKSKLEDLMQGYFSFLCILPSFWLVVQQTCKAKLVFLVARTQKPSNFKNCEIYFTFSLQFIWWICLFFYACFLYDCLF